MSDQLNCPRCNNEMVCTSIDDVVTVYSAFQCPSCEGFWFAKSLELQKLSKVADLSAFEFVHLPSIEKQMEPLICPNCSDKRLMDKVEHKRDRRVIMDVCPECHGVWLDPGELDAIQHETWGSMLLKLYRWLVKE